MLSVQTILKCLIMDSLRLNNGRRLVTSEHNTHAYVTATDGMIITALKYSKIVALLLHVSLPCLDRMSRKAM